MRDPINLSFESPERAAEFCAYTVAREPWFVAELAQWMVATGGPIEEMDATAESLVPLWEWFVDFVDAGVPGLPEDAVWARCPEVDDRLLMRARPAAERVMHYVRLVLEHYQPTAQWTVLAGDPGYAHFQDTGVPWPGLLAGVQPWSLLELAVAVAKRKARFRRPEQLAESIRWLTGGPLGVKADGVRGPSVLVPYLTADLGPMPEIARVSPVVRWWAEDDASLTPTWTPPAPVPGGLVKREDRILASGAGRAIAEDLDHNLRPLPADQVADTLAALGFTIDDRPVTATDLLAEQPVTVHTDT
ncbi:MAG TPA: hypothetical protein PKB06_10125, partial [Actinotalea sp.]|nr:hypothetical protein [Actinotalea sp.]